MKKVILTVITAMFFTMGQAQEITSAPENNFTPHHVGLSAGGTTGFGFSYRYWPSKWGVQVTGIPIFAEDYTWISAGANALFMMKDNEFVDLFSYLGTSINSNTTTYQIYDPNTNELTETTETRNDLRLGLGVGLKFEIWEVINLNLQAGYGVRNVTTTPGTFLTGEIGLFYHL